MAAWITVYLQEDPPPLTAAALEDGTAAADWWTLGELLDIEEDAVDGFLDRLRWRDDPLEVGVDGERPVQIHRWSDPAWIRERVEELEQEVDPPLPPSVRAHLRDVRAVVALEFGFSHVETLLESVAYLGAHHAHGVRERIEAAGARVLYQPPYSPDLNPIEHAWSKIKTALRAVGARTVDLLIAAIAFVITFITPKDAAGWFKHCGVLPPQPE